jgi:hypothetical protein
MFSDILVFLVAVVSHWQSYVTGGSVTGLIAVVERLSDWKMPKWAYATTFLGVFLLVSFFLTWRDEHTEALKIPVLQAQLQDRDKQIKDLKEKPPQFEVNVPSTVVNIPGQQAYFGPDGAPSIGNYGFGQYIAVGGKCKNFSLYVPAENAMCWIKAFSVDTKPNSENQPVVTQAVEDDHFSQFQKSLGPLRNGQRTTVAPGESSFGTASPGILDDKLDAAFREGKKTILFLGEYNWKDSGGSHTDQACTWLQIGGISNIFAGPGLLKANVGTIWHSCVQHNGLVKSRK